MKRILAIAATFGLASCYAVTDPGPGTTRPQAALPHPASASPSPLSNPTVVTASGVPTYHRDLQRCRAEAAAALGPAGPADDAAALKRALAQPSDGGRVVVAYQPGDVALSRDLAVRQCLARQGYAIVR